MKRMKAMKKANKAAASSARLAQAPAMTGMKACVVSFNVRIAILSFQSGSDKISFYYGALLFVLFLKIKGTTHTPYTTNIGMQASMHVCRRARATRARVARALVWLLLAVVVGYSL